MKKAFTMMELIMVIVIIGILAGIAIPKFAATRSDAEVTKAKTTVASIKASLSTERQLRLLRGDFNAINNLDNDSVASTAISNFSDNAAQAATPALPKTSVLGSTVPSCVGTSRGCWVKNSAVSYTYRMPGGTTNVNFALAGGQFDCTVGTSASGKACATLTQ